MITEDGGDSADDGGEDAEACSGVEPAVKDHEWAPVTCAKVAKTISGFACTVPSRSASVISAITVPSDSCAACSWFVLEAGIDRKSGGKGQGERWVGEGEME